MAPILGIDSQYRQVIDILQWLECKLEWCNFTCFNVNLTMKCIWHQLTKQSQWTTTMLSGHNTHSVTRSWTQGHAILHCTSLKKWCCSGNGCYNITYMHSSENMQIVYNIDKKHTFNETQIQIQICLDTHTLKNHNLGRNYLFTIISTSMILKILLNITHSLVFFSISNLVFSSCFATQDI